MIKSFGNKDTKRVWEGVGVSGLPYEVQEIGRRKLRMINSAQDLRDLSIPPSNKLEKLKGDLNDHFSIRINDQWRVIFRWLKSFAEDVTITDYH